MKPLLILKVPPRIQPWALRDLGHSTAQSLPDYQVVVTPNDFDVSVRTRRFRAKHGPTPRWVAGTKWARP